MAQRFNTLGMEGYRKALKDKGLKATEQRVAVHEAMLRLVHASAEMVRADVMEHGGRITVSSVYNILSQMSDIGIYSRRLGAAGRKMFDVVPTRHLHMYDVVEDEYRDVADPELLELIETHLHRHRFKGHKIEDIDISLVCRPTRRGTLHKAKKHRI